jgi:hypothetical protein
VYASIRHYHAVPGAMDEIMRQIDESFVPIVSGAPGFVAYYVLSAMNDILATISVFEDQAGAEESNHLAAAWVEDTIASLVASAPGITAGEVAVHKTA